MTYSVEVKAADNIEYTVQSATDYYPYGKALRSYGQERYQSTYHERDVESGFDYRGARFYDSDVARFNSLDPLAVDYPSFSDYNYVAGNPLLFVDPDGRRIFVSGHLTDSEGNYKLDEDGNRIAAEGYAVDENGDYIEGNTLTREQPQPESLLIMHRTRLRTDLSDKLTNVWKITFSRKVGDSERQVATPDGTFAYYMFGSAGADEVGDNFLKKPMYKLVFEQMESRKGQKGWENTIWVAGTKTFLHPGNDYGDYGGCKGICSSYLRPGLFVGGVGIFVGENISNSLEQIRFLYNLHEKYLTGDKFILKTNSVAPSGVKPKPVQF